MAGIEKSMSEFSLKGTWFAKEKLAEEVDRLIREKFGTAIEKALCGDFDAWMNNPHGSLALVIILDQFPRNAFRNTERAWIGDKKGFPDTILINFSFSARCLPPRHLQWTR